MNAADADETATALWNEAERTFLAAAALYPDQPLVIVAGVARRANAMSSKAFLGSPENPVPGDPLTEAAANAVTRLAAFLPLDRLPEGGAGEFLIAQPGPENDFQVIVQGGIEEAFVRLLINSSKMEDFIASRPRSRETSSRWDDACQKRLVRSEIFGSRCVIEPGAVWFVEYIESLGMETAFSCEGHPTGFHVVFRGAYELAHAIASAPHAEVSIFRSGRFPEVNQWRLQLRTEPDCREERDRKLRQLADGLAALDLAPLIAGS